MSTLDMAATVRHVLEMASYFCRFLGLSDSNQVFDRREPYEFTATTKTTKSPAVQILINIKKDLLFNSYNFRERTGRLGAHADVKLYCTVRMEGDRQEWY